MKARTAYAAVFVLTGLVAAACAAKKPPPPVAPKVEVIVDAGSDAPEEAEAPKPKSLYERLGKQEGIAALVDSFTKRLQADAKFKGRLAALKGPRLEKFKKELADQICVEGEGPTAGADCKYEGRFMKEALGTKTKIKEDEWNAMLLDLRGAFEDAKVGDNEQGDFVAMLGKFRDDVVVAAKK